MKTFKHYEPEWQCKCTLKKSYNWEDITRGRITITIDEKILGFPLEGIEKCREAVQMAYPMSFWLHHDGVDNTVEFICSECKVYPHRIIPNPLRR